MEFTETMKLEITQDKLVDLLMHAATREDIAITKKELKEHILEVKSELHTTKKELREEILEVKNELHTTKKELREEILEVKNELKEEITKLHTRMDKSDSKNDKILWFVILSMLVPIFLHMFHA